MTGAVADRMTRSTIAERERAAKPRLDLHEGICDPRPPDGCGRWPETLFLVNGATGEAVHGRCRATNLCRYCQKLYVVETVEMLTLDAMEYAPTFWMVLTAREHLTRKDTYAHLRQLRKVLKRRWPDVEWFVQVEFQRRGALHLNLLIKGVPLGDVEALYDAVTQLWCSRVDAVAAPYDRMEKGGQWIQAVEDGVGVVRYISKMLAHGLKAEQAPPIGWRGHRTSQTRGYLVRPASVMREEARRSIKIKRELYRGATVDEAEQLVDEAAEVEWALRGNAYSEPPSDEVTRGRQWKRLQARAARRAEERESVVPMWREHVAKRGPVVTRIGDAAELQTRFRVAKNQLHISQPRDWAARE